jgi:hypothetical protein
MLTIKHVVLIVLTILFVTGQAFGADKTALEYIHHTPDRLRLDALWQAILKHNSDIQPFPQEADIASGLNWKKADHRCHDPARNVPF